MPYKETYPSALLTEAVEAISSLPGVGRRSALRLALHLLKQPAENVHHFTGAIDALRDNVCYCKRCRMISDDEICSICSDKTRDQRTICVVESVRDVMSIEATGQYWMALLYLCYIGSAVYGYFHWKKRGKYLTLPG